MAVSGKKNNQYKHGMKNHSDPRVRSVYNTWTLARGRCNNPNNADYHSYGGRGIKFSPLWDHFPDFLAAVGFRPEGKTLDRIDVDKNYEPGNVRWATAKEQAQNQRRTRWV